MAVQPNTKINSRPTFTIDPATDTEKEVELIHGHPTFYVDVRVAGTLEVTSGTAGDQVVRPEAVARLFDVEVRVEGQRNITLVKKMPLRLLLMYHGLNVVTFPTVTDPSQSNLNSQSDADFDLHVRIYGSPRTLFRRHENYWPAFNGDQAMAAESLKLILYPDTSKVNSSSDAGTGALLSAGSDTIAFKTGPEITIEQHYAPGHVAGVNGRPKYIPRYVEERTTSFTSADERFEEKLTLEHRIAMLLIRHQEGSDADAVDSDTGRWNKLSVRSDEIEIYDERQLAMLEEEMIGLFDAYAGMGAGDDFDGHLPVPLAPGGRVNSAFSPKDFTNSRLEFDVDDPSSDPGRFVYLAVQMLTPGDL